MSILLDGEEILKALNPLDDKVVKAVFPSDRRLLQTQLRKVAEYVRALNNPYPDKKGFMAQHEAFETARTVINNEIEVSLLKEVGLKE